MENQAQESKLIQNQLKKLSSGLIRVNQDKKLIKSQNLLKHKKSSKNKQRSETSPFIQSQMTKTDSKLSTMNLKNKLAPILRLVRQINDEKDYLKDQIDFMLSNFSYILDLFEINLIKCLEQKFYSILKQKNNTLQKLKKRLDNFQTQQINLKKYIQEQDESIQGLNEKIEKLTKQNKDLKKKIQEKENWKDDSPYHFNYLDKPVIKNAEMREKHKSMKNLLFEQSEKGKKKNIMKKQDLNKIMEIKDKIHKLKDQLKQ